MANAIIYFTNRKPTNAKLFACHKIGNQQIKVMKRGIKSAVYQNQSVITNFIIVNTSL